MKYISPTFLDSFAYYKKTEDPEVAQVKRQELINRLRGVKTPSTEAQQRGIDFENDVCAACDELYAPKNEKYDRCVNQIAKIVKGGERQVKVEKQILQDVSILGYMDFLKDGRIYDVKTTQQYTWGQYKQYTQHLAYLFWGIDRDIKHCEYLVMDFGGMYTTDEEYYWNHMFESILRGRVMDFMHYCEHDEKMYKAFEEHKPYFKRRNDDGGLGL